MQISNPAISQYISRPDNRSQPTDRNSVKPITIEGQLEKEEKRTGNSAQSYSDIEQTEKTAAGLLTSSSSAAQIIQPASTDNFSGAVLIQQRSNNSPGLSSSTDSTSSIPNFPYGSRRSFAGLSGGSLVIQQYLNNEIPPGMQRNSAEKIDLFI